MVSITLVDKGKYDVTGTYPTSGTEEKGYGSDGVSGNALNMHIFSIVIEDNAIIINEPEPQRKKSNSDNKRYEEGEADSNGIEFSIWTLKGIVDVSDTAQLQDYGRLRHMLRTKGYKQLGFSPSGGTLDRAEILTYAHYGIREADGEGTKTITTVNVKLMSLSIDQVLSKGYMIAYTLKLLETN